MIDSEKHTRESRNPNVINLSIEVEHLVKTLIHEVSQEIETGHIQIQPNKQKTETEAKQHDYADLQEFRDNSMLEHKSMVKKFIKHNKKIERDRRIRSLEISEKEMRQKEKDEEIFEEEKMKRLEERRKEIANRMEEKERIKKEIERSAVQSNSHYFSLKKRKQLFDQKQEEFTNSVIATKIQEEREILQKRREEFLQPIDHEKLQEHSKKYDDILKSRKRNRSLTMSLIKRKSKGYSPPNFVSEAYLKMKKEEEKEMIQEELKRKKVEINQLKKKEFLRKIEEFRELERELESHEVKPKTTRKEHETPEKKYDRYYLLNVGNDYLRQLKSSNNKRKKLESLKTAQEEKTEQKASKPKSSKTSPEVTNDEPFSLEKLRAQKISQIIKSQNTNEITKQERLKYEFEKLDKALSHKIKEGNKTSVINESANILINSIHAKLAYLKLAKGESEEQN